MPTSAGVVAIGQPQTKNWIMFANRLLIISNREVSEFIPEKSWFIKYFMKTSSSNIVYFVTYFLLWNIF